MAGNERALRLSAEAAKELLSGFAVYNNKTWAEQAYNEVKDVDFTTANLDKIKNSIKIAQSRLVASDNPACAHTKETLMKLLELFKTLQKEKKVQSMPTDDDGITLWPGMPQ